VTQDFSGDGDLVALFRAGLSDIATSGGGCCIGRDETRSSRRGSEPVRSRGWVHLTHQRWTGQRPIGGRDKDTSPVFAGCCFWVISGGLRGYAAGQVAEGAAGSCDGGRRGWPGDGFVTGLLYPLLRFIPTLCDWSMRSRVFRLYGEMRFLELQIERGDAERDLNATAAQLDRIEQRANQLKVPKAYASMVYSLLGHIALVHHRLKGRPLPSHASTQHSRVDKLRPTDPGRPEGSDEWLWQGD